MGVDSGLPDFRGTAGFWNAYPPLKHLGIDFQSMAQPRWFTTNPAMAWGFYGSRMMLYRQTQPHSGFQLLLRWARSKVAGSFVFTSNVDGHFQKAGFDEERVVECHGSLSHVQDEGQIKPAAFDLTIDMEKLHCLNLPKNSTTGELLRPAVLMFNDGGWISDRTDAQEERLEQWYSGVKDKSLAVVELGAGAAVPTVRYFSERAVARPNATLIRINPRESEIPRGLGSHHFSFPFGAKATLERLDAFMREGVKA